jgi:hypothetical protein
VKKMKKNILKYLSVLAAVLLVSSCEWDPPTFDSADSFIAYANSSSSVAEEGGMVGIPVLVTAPLDAASVSVDFAFNTDASTAVEGTNFTLVNESKTLSISAGWGYDTIWIQPIDNDIFTGNLILVIDLTSNSKEYPFGVVSTHTLTIIDNEHPLGAWIGAYSVDCQDYFSVFGPETWNVTTEPDPDDVNNLVITGIGNGFAPFTPITGVVDLDALTITLTAGSEIGTHADYSGPLAIFKMRGEWDLVEEPIVGQLSEDGGIVIDSIGYRFVGGLNEGLDWGGFKTTWTPAKKKSAFVYPELGDMVIREIKLEQ